LDLCLHRVKFLIIFPNKPELAVFASLILFVSTACFLENHVHICTELLPKFISTQRLLSFVEISYWGQLKFVVVEKNAAKKI